VKTSKTASPTTRLQRFLQVNGLTSARLEKEIHMSRQSLTKIRGGHDVRQGTMLRILRGCRALTGRKVLMDEIFDLDPDSPERSA
jgi:predicted transcriptional regulator